MEHPHTRHRGMVVELEGYCGIASPVKLSRTPASYRAAPPVLGGEPGSPGGTGIERRGDRRAGPARHRPRLKPLTARPAPCNSIPGQLEMAMDSPWGGAPRTRAAGAAGAGCGPVATEPPGSAQRPEHAPARGSGGARTAPRRVRRYPGHRPHRKWHGVRRRRRSQRTGGGVRAGDPAARGGAPLAGPRRLPQAADRRRGGLCPGRRLRVGDALRPDRRRCLGALRPAGNPCRRDARRRRHPAPGASGGQVPGAAHAVYRLHGTGAGGPGHRGWSARWRRMARHWIAPSNWLARSPAATAGAGADQGSGPGRRRSAAGPGPGAGAQGLPVAVRQPRPEGGHAGLPGKRTAEYLGK